MNPEQEVPMRALVLAAALVSLPAAVACSKSEAPGADPTGPAGAAAKAPPPIPPRSGTPLDDVLDGYEQVRAALAADDLATAKGAAADKVTPAAAAALAAAAGPEAHVKTIQDSAGAIAAAADIRGARAAFGDLSKATISLLSEKPELQTGRFLFMCPMVKGYQKWVQWDAQLKNPYYGKEMLMCGEQLAQWAS
jgi:membrane fusion protein, copper/silver efflux system